MFHFGVKILIFHCTFFPLDRIIQVNSAIFVSAALNLKLCFGASKAFVRKIFPLSIFFKPIYATFWCLFTDLTVYFVLNKSMGWIPPARLWQTSKATYILQMNKLRVQTLKMEKQPWILLHACCSSLVAFCLLFTTNKWGQTPTPFFFWYEHAPVSPTATVCAFAASTSLGWCSVPTSWSLVPPCLTRGIALLFFWLFSPVYCGIVFFFSFFFLSFFFFVAHPPGLFSSCFKIVLESGEKKQTSWVLEGLVHYFKSRMEINGETTQRGERTEADRERGAAPAVTGL